MFTLCHTKKEIHFYFYDDVGKCGRWSDFNDRATVAFTDKRRKRQNQTLALHRKTVPAEVNSIAK